MTFQLQLGLDIIRSYKRLDYTPWHALAEFVDNSTQAYFNNQNLLDSEFVKRGEKLEVSIVYERDPGLIRITDNSIGMSREELEHALHIGARPANATGRSRFGMGLKTAACWLGDEWTVRTKKLGCDTEYTVRVDVESVASGDATLPTEVRTNLDPSTHYTAIEIFKLNRKFHTRTLNKIKTFLASMYREDFRKNRLILCWQGERLGWNDSDERFVQAVDGSRYKKDFLFTVNGKSVRGWIGILDAGYRSRLHAGFSILHSGRVIMGFPESWRPESIFGQPGGSNDLINQRITGEIHLDEFEVSHTKDSIQWLGDEEAEVQEKLKAIAAPFVSIVRQSSRSTSDGPTDLEIKVAVDELQQELNSPELADIINITIVPPPEVVRRTLQPLLDSTITRTPSFKGKVGELEVDGYLIGDGSPNDPYVLVDCTSTSRVVVAINMRHPYISELSGSEGMLNYLRHCTYDAIAEWKARHMTSPIDPDTAKILKDQLLRLPSQIEMHPDSSREEASSAATPD